VSRLSRCWGGGGGGGGGGDDVGDRSSCDGDDYHAAVHPMASGAVMRTVRKRSIEVPTHARVNHRALNTHAHGRCYGSCSSSLCYGVLLATFTTLALLVSALLCDARRVVVLLQRASSDVMSPCSVT
jgi:hypothetical protein